MRVALIQSNPGYLQTEENLRGVEPLVEEADADLVVLPELFASGYFFHNAAHVEEVAETIPNGLVCQRLVGWARDTGATIVAGVAERSASGALFNSAVVMTPRGWLGTYRKSHLFYQEKLYFAPGDSGFRVFTVADRTGGAYRLGVMICFDWYFPEAARSLALSGADIIAHPSNLVRPDCPRSMPTRALENHVFTATANRVGAETREGETLTYIGQSLVCNPDGHIIASASAHDTAVVTADINPLLSRNRRLTDHNDLFADRRPHLYDLS